MTAVNDSGIVSRRIGRVITVVVGAAAVAAPAASPAATPPGDWFSEIAAPAGIHFIHFNGMSGERLSQPGAGAVDALRLVTVH